MGIFPTLLCARKRLERRAEDVVQDMNCNDIYVSAPVEPGWPGYSRSSRSSSGDFSSPKPGQFGYGSKPGEFASRSGSISSGGFAAQENFQQQQGFFYNPNKSQLSLQSDQSPSYGYGHKSSSSARGGWPDQEQQKLQFKCSTDSGWIVVDTRLKEEDPVSAAAPSSSSWRRSSGATAAAGSSGMHRSCSFRG